MSDLGNQRVRAADVAVYDSIGCGYALTRRADPRFAAAIDAALGDASSVLNVGAGTGSYEPATRRVVAIDPSAVMLAQRSGDAPPSLRARAEALPIRDRAFDAVLGVLTLQHWTDRIRGLRECRRVAVQRIVLVTFDPAADGFWFTRDYVPEFWELDRANFPAIDLIASALDPARIEVRSLPIPRDCHDGFLGAFWARPDFYFDPHVRAGISSFARVDASAGLSRLRFDLDDGTWYARYGDLLARDSLDIGYRLLIAELPPHSS